MNLTAIARYVVGAIFTIFGANKLVAAVAGAGFMPMPPMEGAAGAFMGGLSEAPYFWPVMGLIEVGGGLMLLSGKFVPLGITVLAGPIIQILLFHLVLAPGLMEIGMAVVLTVGALLIARGYRDSFAGVLDMNASPS